MSTTAVKEIRTGEDPVAVEILRCVRDEIPHLVYMASYWLAANKPDRAEQSLSYLANYRKLESRLVAHLRDVALIARALDVAVTSETQQARHFHYATIGLSLEDVASVKGA